MDLEPKFHSVNYAASRNSEDRQECGVALMSPRVLHGQPGNEKHAKLVRAANDVDNLAVFLSDGA